MLEFTLETLKKHLQYNEETGDFIWLTRLSRSRPIGSKAGYKRPNGYWCIKIFDVTYRAHRLAWLYVYGEMPNGYLDHINRNKIDNRIVNLRLATDLQNNFNTDKKSNNTSGSKGVSYSKAMRKWRSIIKINGKQKYLGIFQNKIDAEAAYVAASIKYHGEFSIYRQTP